MTQETVAGRTNSVLAGERGAAPEFAVLAALPLREAPLFYAGR